ncbi:phenylacetate--CoA ligase family protein [Nocardia macrotermitis]|uniref:phenylacetate--CoA ligase family protein n=1 Tax=Nocardia macrotermitis TaxID=2585198 RepID=UPI001885EB86|nr:phenylacetate--CoA ligase family protein [Nocardia macrotermitis]
MGEVWSRARASKAYAHLSDYSFDSFQLLPTTDKDEIKKNPWDFIIDDGSGAVKYYETTGTSGLVTPTPRTADDIIWNTVSVARAWLDLLRDDDRVAVLLPSDIVPVADLIAGVCEYRRITHTRNYPFTTGVSDWDRLIRLWEVYRPTVLFGAPGLALQLMRLLQHRGIFTDVAAHIRAIMLLGEVSTPALRDRLGSWWGAEVFDASYGSTETGTLAAACDHDRQHLMTATNYFELSDGNQVSPLESTDSGILVTTPLNLFARPLLRLDTGDEVTVHRDCSCGNLAPSITVHGRSSDAVTIAGNPLTIRSVEDVVYGATAATGYLIEIDSEGQRARILLERGYNTNRLNEDEQIADLQNRSEFALGFRWHQSIFVNSLPVITKSGGSQKSWKRSNIRVLEAL